MINLLIVLATALVGRKICIALKQPIILGELLAGIAISLLGLAHVTEPIDFIANLGILILVFTTGLALDFDELKRLGKAAATIALTESFFSFAFGYVLAVACGFSVAKSLFVGSILVATSIGVNAKILSEFNVLKTKIGTLIMGSAVFDDVIGILVLGFIGGLATQGEVVGRILMLALATVAFFVFSLFFATPALKWLSRKISFSSENTILIGLIIAFAFALGAKEAGLELIIGAFLGGLVLGQTAYSKDLLEHISIFGEAFFIPIFFVAIGMKFDLMALATAGLFALLLVLTAMASKIVGCLLGGVISGSKVKEAATIGIAMIPRAEVPIIIMGIGLSTHMIGNEIASAVLAMVIVTALITPPMLTLALKRLKETNTNTKRNDLKQFPA